MPYTYPSLTPFYGLGSYGRTGSSIIISSPRNKIGSQNRIYGWMKTHGQGPQYIQFLISQLPRNPNNPRYAWSNI